MSKETKQNDRIILEFPEIIAYQNDKKSNHIYLCLFDKWNEQEFTILFESYELLQWLGTKEIKEIKKSLVNEIEKL